VASGAVSPRADPHPEETTLRPSTTSLTWSALALGLAACGGAAETAAPADAAAADVTVVADDVVYVDPPAELPSGRSVLAIDNVGDAPHDLTVEGVDGATVGAAGGELTAGEVTLEPGTYTVYCSVSGHREAGMEFEVAVG
jgi:plastocyanin